MSTTSQCAVGCKPESALTKDQLRRVQHAPRLAPEGNGKPNPLTPQQISEVIEQTWQETFGPKAKHQADMVVMPGGLWRVLRFHRGTIDILACLFVSDLLYWWRPNAEGKMRFRGPAPYFIRSELAARYAVTVHAISEMFGRLKEAQLIVTWVHHGKIYARPKVPSLQGLIRASVPTEPRSVAGRQVPEDIHAASTDPLERVTHGSPESDPRVTGELPMDQRRVIHGSSRNDPQITPNKRVSHRLPERSENIASNPPEDAMRCHVPSGQGGGCRPQTPAVHARKPGAEKPACQEPGNDLIRLYATSKEQEFLGHILQTLHQRGKDLGLYRGKLCGWDSLPELYARMTQEADLVLDEDDHTVRINKDLIRVVAISWTHAGLGKTTSGAGYDPWARSMATCNLASLKKNWSATNSKGGEDGLIQRMGEVTGKEVEQARALTIQVLEEITRGFFGKPMWSKKLEADRAGAQIKAFIGDVQALAKSRDTEIDWGQPHQALRRIFAEEYRTEHGADLRVKAWEEFEGFCWSGSRVELSLEMLAQHFQIRGVMRCYIRRFGTTENGNEYLIHFFRLVAEIEAPALSEGPGMELGGTQAQCPGKDSSGTQAQDPGRECRTQTELAALLAKAREKLSAGAEKLILDDLQTQLVLGCWRAIPCNGGSPQYMMGLWVKETVTARNLTPAIVDQVVRYHAARYADQPEVFALAHGTYWMAMESGIPLDWTPGDAKSRLANLKKRLQK